MKELKNNRVSTFLLCISQLLYNKGRARDSWGRPLGLLIIRANMAVTICEIPGRTPLWADGTKERTVNYSILVSCSLSLSLRSHLKIDVLFVCFCFLFLAHLVQTNTAGRYEIWHQGRPTFNVV